MGGIRRPEFGGQPPHCPVCLQTSTSVTEETVPRRLCDPEDREPGTYRSYQPCGHVVASGAAEEDVEPLLASEASRRFMELHDTTGTPVHELAADAIRLAEDRSVEAVMRALDAEVSDTGVVHIAGRWDKRELMRRIEKELGR